MSATELTIQTLDENGGVIAETGLTLTETYPGTDGDGTDDGLSFINTKGTFLIFWSNHTATVVATVEPREATIQSAGLGELDVDNLTVTVAIGNTIKQTAYLWVPPGYNPATGKAIVKLTSGTPWSATGKVKLAAVALG